jgi:hypothetical protein
VRPIKTLGPNADQGDFFRHRHYEVEHGALAYPDKADLWMEILKDFPDDMDLFNKHPCDACLLRWWDFFTSWTELSICPSYVRMLEHAEADKWNKRYIEEMMLKMRGMAEYFTLWVTDKANGGNSLHWPVR